MEVPRKVLNLAPADIMMVADLYSLQLILERIRTLQDELVTLRGGVATLHMDAAVAALECHIIQQLNHNRPATQTFLQERLF